MEPKREVLGAAVAAVVVVAPNNEVGAILLLSFICAHENDELMKNDKN